MFYEWLLAQRARHDDVGGFALLATSDKTFPRRSHKLHVLLAHCNGNATLRRVTKKAHAEYRAQRDVHA